MPQKTTSTLYSLWLPITDFIDFSDNIKKYLKTEEIILSENSNWSWIEFIYLDANIIIDSLGFIYFDKVKNIATRDELLLFLIENLNHKSITNIVSTFLNKNIGFQEKDENSLFKFLQSIITPFETIDNKLQFAHIMAILSVDGKSVSSTEGLKFSLTTLDDGFHTILNRNFQSLLNKSIFFTHGLYFEKGEIYNLTVVENTYENIEKLPELKLHINGIEKLEKRKKLFEQVVKKVVQDTMEEKTILHFLKITKINYLSKIIDEISINNEILKKLNSYLLEDIERDKNNFINRTKDLDDESATEIFIQNLLQVIPKFYMMDSKIQEAYYIKIGNTTTNLNVKREETISNTLYYKKWKASIKFFIQTATKAKESLNMYHQNKTLKELEDISYNANYQADIEDIRELKKQKDVSLDEETRRYFDKVVLFLGVITLAGEAPIWTYKDEYDTWTNMAYILLNSGAYFLLLKLVASPILKQKNLFIEFKETFKKFYKKLLKKNSVTEKKLYEVHAYEESDYDKHEHRSNRSLYSFNRKEELYQKIFIEYNNLISSYSLVKKLKKISLTQKTSVGKFDFELFPELLSHAPIGIDNRHIYRENYRISGNDRVATKIMYRYKISDLTLHRLLEYMRRDKFMIEYEKYLKYEDKENFSLFSAMDILEPHIDYKEKTKVTLYIVYSFVLKFYSADINNNSIYNYTISKDQFRVHYHINEIDYTNPENFEDKQSCLAKLIDIYFLRRLKRFKEVEESTTL